MHFHLHITVQPHWSWTHADLADALTQDVARHGVKPLVITNHFRDGRKPYKELIPSKVYEADSESDASREIFRLGVLLNNSGWRVKRLKIEGDPRHPAIAARALYYETHLKNVLATPDLPRSSTAKGNVFHTVRWSTRQMQDVGLPSVLRDVLPCLRGPPEIEAAVLDTNPQLDHDWINQ